MSLEERRAERRRRRQMEEESLDSGTTSTDDIHADIQERLARRRQEREERMANIASSVATVNGEDDLERRRRDRREQRLRGSGDTDTAKDNYSSPHNRHNSADDNTTQEAPEINEQPATSVQDTSEEDAAEERRRQQRAEEEEEARRQAEREAAEEQRQREAALEEERRREDEARRLAEEERQRQEEEERRNDEAGSGSERSSEDYTHENEAENKLFIEEDNVVTKDDVGNDNSVDKLERVRQWNEESNNVGSVETQHGDNIGNKNESYSGEAGEESSLDRSGREINNNKITDKLNKFEHLREESDSRAVKDKTSQIPLAENYGLKGKLQKFEKEIKEQETISRDTYRASPHPVKRQVRETVSRDTYRSPLHAGNRQVSTSQPHRLTEKLQQFESAAKSQSASKPTSRNTQLELATLRSSTKQRQSMLGRWSMSETHINRTETRDIPKKNVLERWKSLDKHQQESPNVTSPTEKKLQLNKRLSGNTEFIASRYLEKASKSMVESSPQAITTHSHGFTQSFGQRRTSQTSETLSEVSEDSSSNQSRVTHRWPFKDGDSKSGEHVVQTQRHSRGELVGHSRGELVGYSRGELVAHSRGELIGHSRGELVGHSRGELVGHSRGELGGHSRGELVGHSRGELVGHSRGELVAHSRGELVAHSRGELVGHSRGGHSRESSNDNTHSRGSSIDASSESSRKGSRLIQEEEEEQERLRQEEEARATRMAAEEGQKKRGKRKGLGGLTPEKKKKLKEFTADIQYSNEDIDDKERELSERVQPLPEDLDYLSTAELRKLIKGLHDKLAQIHSEAYDIEFKLNKQEKEIVDLNMKIMDSRGRFAKPVLRKVNKTEQKFAALSKIAKEKDGFRDTLKSAHDDEDGAE